MKAHTSSALARCLLGVAVLGAVAGTAMAAPPATPASTPASTPAGDNMVGDVVSGPFKDLNLMKKEIPAVLSALGGQPYQPPADGTCSGLAAEVLALDAVLGPDLDGPPPAGQASSRSAAKALTQASHSLVPYRSWIRKLSGAEKRAERLAAALLTGTARRAFLKGLGAAQGCEPPAAPLPRAPAMEPEGASGASTD